MAARKKPRTAGQKRATKKLIAFNKARGRLNKKRAKPPARKRTNRSPAQKRATRLLIANNRLRARGWKTGKLKAARKLKASRKLVALNKSRKLVPMKRGRKTTKRKSRGWIIRAKVGSSGASVYRYWTGKGFILGKSFAKKYITEASAEKAARSMLRRLPIEVLSITVCRT